MSRSMSLTLVLGALLLTTLVAAPGVAAQDDAMSPADHPLVGAWLIAPTEDEPPELFTASSDGIVVDAGSQGTGYGAWAATGDRSADLTFLSPMIDPEAGLLGYVTIRASVVVAEDGQSVAGSWTVEFPAEAAEAMGFPIGELGPGEVSGQRIVVEAMGEPVGPAPAPGELPSE